MPSKKYIVELTTEERSQLNAIVHADRMVVYKRRHAEFIACMEDVLEVYHRPWDPSRPLATS